MYFSNGQVVVLVVVRLSVCLSVCPSVRPIFLSMRYINLHFTYLLTYVCTVAKRCKIGPWLLLIIDRKSHIGFQMK